MGPRIDFAQIDSTNVIAEATKLTAQNTTLGSYDYSAITISFIALVVAVATYFISKKTLKAQEETVKNTSTFELKDQIYFLKELFMIAYADLIRSIALKRMLSNDGRILSPYTDIAAYMELPLYYLQEGTCNGLKNDLYIVILKLRKYMTDYNNRIKIRIGHLSDPALDGTTRQRDLNRLVMESCMLVKAILSALCILRNGSTSGDEDDKDGKTLGQSMIEAFNKNLREDKTTDPDAVDADTETDTETDPVTYCANNLLFENDIKNIIGVEQEGLEELISTGVDLMMRKNRRGEEFAECVPCKQ